MILNKERIIIIIALRRKQILIYKYNRQKSMVGLKDKLYNGVLCNISILYRYVLDCNGHRHEVNESMDSYQ